MLEGVMPTAYVAQGRASSPGTACRVTLMVLVLRQNLRLQFH